MKFEQEVIMDYMSGLSHDAYTDRYSIEFSFRPYRPVFRFGQQALEESDRRVDGISLRFSSEDGHKILDMMKWNPRRIKLTIEEIE